MLSKGAFIGTFFLVILPYDVVDTLRKCISIAVPIRWMEGKRDFIASGNHFFDFEEVRGRSNLQYPNYIQLVVCTVICSSIETIHLFLFRIAGLAIGWDFTFHLKFVRAQRAH